MPELPRVALAVQHDRLPRLWSHIAQHRLDTRRADFGLILHCNKMRQQVTVGVTQADKFNDGLVSLWVV